MPKCRIFFIEVYLIYFGGGHDHSLQCSCLENPHGQKSLLGYSPWGHKELDSTE